MASGTDDREQRGASPSTSTASTSSSPAARSQGDGTDGELRVFVGIGGNLGDRLATMRSAVEMIDAEVVPQTRVVAASGVYETTPVGPSEGAFLNAVIEVRTRLGLEELLTGLLGVEARHGRERRRKWDARTLDLDVLVAQRWDGEAWETVEVERDGLRVPHPEIGGRDFVLVPLRDVAGGEVIVRGRSVEQWLRGLEGGARTILRRLQEGLLPSGGEGGGGEAGA